MMQSPSPQLLRALRSRLATPASPCSRPHLSKSPSLRHTQTPLRPFHQRAFVLTRSPPNPKLQTRDRGPRSKEDTQTDFDTLNIYSNSAPPATNIDACLSDGFHINNGLKITGGAGVFLLGGEAYTWRPWTAGVLSPVPSSSSSSSQPDPLLTPTGALDLSHPQIFGLLSLVNALPDLLILGTGATTRPITKSTRELLAGMGVKVDVMDTNNAAASFNLLSTERGTEGVAAAMLPIGWRAT